MQKEEGEPNYKVVDPPAGVTVPYLPDDAKETKIDGDEYFVVGDTYYQEFSNGGKTIYMVVENPKAAS